CRPAWNLGMIERPELSKSRWPFPAMNSRSPSWPVVDLVESFSSPRYSPSNLPIHRCQGSLSSRSSPTSTRAGEDQPDSGRGPPLRYTTRFGEGFMSTAHMTQRPFSYSSDGESSRRTLMSFRMNSFFADQVTPSVEVE